MEEIHDFEKAIVPNVPLDEIDEVIELLEKTFETKRPPYISAKEIDRNDKYVLKSIQILKKYKENK